MMMRLYDTNLLAAWLASRDSEDARTPRFFFLQERRGYDRRRSRSFHAWWNFLVQLLEDPKASPTNPHHPKRSSRLFFGKKRLRFTDHEGRKSPTVKDGKIITDGMTTTTLGVLSLLLHRDTSFIASSDSQLAICSRVCKTWRKSAIDAIAQCAMKGVLSATGGVDRGTTTKGEPEADNNNNESRSGHTWDNPLQDLLLTEMAKMMVLRCITQNNDHCQQHSRHGGPFCLAWFDPSGIQTTEIHVVDNGFRDDGEGRRTRYHKKIAGKECCHEWRGYRTPSEVLGPFGYDDKFVFVSFSSFFSFFFGRMIYFLRAEPSLD